MTLPCNDRPEGGGHCGRPAVRFYDVAGYGDDPVICRCADHVLDSESWKARQITEDGAAVLWVMAS